MEKKVCEICGSEKEISEFSKSYKKRCKTCVAQITKLQRSNKGKTENIDGAILIAESVVTLVESMGMISENQERLSNGLSIGYSGSVFSYMAAELRDKIETFKKQSNT